MAAINDDLRKIARKTRTSPEYNGDKRTISNGVLFGIHGSHAYPGRPDRVRGIGLAKDFSFPEPEVLLTRRSYSDVEEAN